MTANSEQLSFLDYQPTSVSAPTAERSLPIHVDYLSYSQIETFRTCPLHYKLSYIFKVPIPPSASLSFGSSLHAVMNEFYERVNQGAKPTEKVIAEILNEKWVKEGYTSKAHEEKFFEKGKFYLSGYLKEEFDP